MKILIGGIMLGVLIAWGSSILFIGWYLKERDEVITDLMAENKALRNKSEKWDNHFNKTNSGY